jgi:hypothetical protein
MSIETTTIPAEIASNTLWVFGYRGAEPGSFTRRLIDTIAHADRVNEARLAQVFPAEAAAVRLAKYDDQGIAKLQVIADEKAAA